MMTDTIAPIDLETIYRQMESAEEDGGYFQRRILPLHVCNIYIAVQKPLNTRLMKLDFSADAIPADYELPEFRVLGVTRENQIGENSRVIITLYAAQESFIDVFTRLVEDIALKVSAETSDMDTARALRARLIQWQRLLQAERASGLTAEEQRGLFGELFALKNLVLTCLPSETAVQSWTGPDGTAKDFNFKGGYALEVKTSLARPPHEIRISSERQLDGNGLTALLLLHFLVDAQRGAGESLPDMVRSVRTLLASDSIALGQFEDRLLDAGYFEMHSGRYKDTGYMERGTHLYDVREGFPRIVEADLPTGVGKVEYVVSAAACAAFTRPVNTIERLLRM